MAQEEPLFVSFIMYVFICLFIYSYSPIIVLIYSLNHGGDTSEQNKLPSAFVPHVYKGIIA